MVPDTDNSLACVFIKEGTLNVSIYCYVVSKKIQTRCPVKRSTDSTLVLTE